MSYGTICLPYLFTWLCYIFEEPINFPSTPRTLSVVIDLWGFEFGIIITHLQKPQKMLLVTLEKKKPRLPHTTRNAFIFSYPSGIASCFARVGDVVPRQLCVCYGFYLRNNKYKSEFKFSILWSARERAWVKGSKRALFWFCCSIFVHLGKVMYY